MKGVGRSARIFLAVAAMIGGPPVGEAARAAHPRADTAPRADATTRVAAAPHPDAPPVRLAVPVIAQAPERCGPAALAMVLRFYGASDSAVAGTERAYSSALRGALITDLSRCAERAGFAARVASLDEDSLLVLLRAGVPPVLHYRRGPGALTRGHFGVLVGWDPARDEFLVNDGGARTARLGRPELIRRWRAAGSLALVVERRPP